MLWVHGSEGTDSQRGAVQLKAQLHQALAHSCGVDVLKRLSLKPLPGRKRRSNLTIPQYNRLLTDPKFYTDVCAAEHVLVLQTDAAIMPHAPYGLAYFWQVMQSHDYLGAVFPQWNDLPWSLTVGNGGASWRRTSALVKARRTGGLGKFQPKKHYNEDVYWSYYGRQHGVRVGSTMDARRFAVDEALGPNAQTPLTQPWLVHKVWRHRVDESTFGGGHTPGDACRLLRHVTPLVQRLMRRQSLAPQHEGLSVSQ